MLSSGSLPSGTRSVPALSLPSSGQRAISTPCCEFRAGVWINAAGTDQRGRDTYRKAKGKIRLRPATTCSTPDNNIELGTAYLNVLTYSQLDDVTDLVSREYCVISAYKHRSR